MDQGTEDRLNAQSRRFIEVMHAKRALPACFRMALEDAVVTGRMPPRQVLLEESARMERFEAAMPDGGPLWDAGEIGWCTVKHHYGWSLPTEELLDEVVACVGTGRRLVEVGAGSGFLAAVLRARGLDVLATDAGTWKSERWERKWHPVERVDARAAILANPGVPVLLCWVDPRMRADVLDAIEPGTLVFRVGEGSTGGEGFNASFMRGMEILASRRAWSASGHDDPALTCRKRAVPLAEDAVPQAEEQFRYMGADTRLRRWRQAWEATRETQAAR